ncbi:hypothetical protein U14_04351 [Candidatus Moduliflexus flocculans]|uniref:Uncharacterized protein n=1 Tax=Candidatus Moduliflexus flocculans TaxID=1499966 RepID=A0A0S6W3Z7_9BACT|nr:hypothetical protein U14_04351 [Candidatus Moduliflexus flocculans]
MAAALRTGNESRPSRARGLKLIHQQIKQRAHAVAPLAGAWIETSMIMLNNAPNPVAPLAGAWIETGVLKRFQDYRQVAPLAGAWIET